MGRRTQTQTQFQGAGVGAAGNREHDLRRETISLGSIRGARGGNHKVPVAVRGPLGVTVGNVGPLRRIGWGVFVLDHALRIE